MRNDGPSERDSANPTAHDKHHRTYERRYWRRQLKIAKTLNLITIAGVLAAGASLYVLKGSLDAAKEAADASVKQTEIGEKGLIGANRAWLGVTHMGVQLPISDERTMVQLQLVNFGRTPALHVMWSPLNLILVPRIAETNNVSALEGEPNFTCRKLGVTNTLVVWPFLPDHNMGVPIQLDASQNDRAKVIAAKARTGSLIVQGCIIYQTFGETHKSAFEFLWRDTPDQPYWQWLFNVALDGNEAD